MKTRPILTRSISSLLLIGAIPEARAGNTWTGGGTSLNWSDNGNWGGAQPTYAR